MTTPEQRPISYAPSSEPFYVNIPNAPLSSNDYAPAPPVGSDSYGNQGRVNPYQGMGYDLLPPEEGALPPAPPPPAAVNLPSGAGAGPDHGLYPAGPPEVADLYRAPGNPYADRSGRPITASLPTAASPAPAPPPSSAPAPGPFAPPPHQQRQERKLGVGATIGLVFAVVFAGILIWTVLSGVSQRSSGETAEPTVADTDLREGMCFQELSYVQGNHLQPVPCAEPHRFEVARNVPGPWADYPGEEDVAEFASEACTGVAEELTARFSTRPLNSHSLYPSEATWEAGDRNITCFIAVAGNVRLHGSAYDGDLEVR